MPRMLTSPASLPSSASSIVPEYPPLRRTILAGVLLVLVGFGGFGAWAALAPLASAAVAPGIVTADTNRKTVQHLDGGVIAEIAVRDGDRVEARQVLMRLDDLETRSIVTLLEGQRRAQAPQGTRPFSAPGDRGKPGFPKAPADLGRQAAKAE